MPCASCLDDLSISYPHHRRLFPFDVQLWVWTSDFQISNLSIGLPFLLVSPRLHIHHRPSIDMHPVSCHCRELLNCSSIHKSLCARRDFPRWLPSPTCLGNARMIHIAWRYIDICPAFLFFLSNVWIELWIHDDPRLIVGFWCELFSALCTYFKRAVYTSWILFSEPTLPCGCVWCFSSASTASNGLATPPLNSAPCALISSF